MGGTELTVVITATRGSATEQLQIRTARDSKYFSCSGYWDEQQSIYDPEQLRHLKSLSLLDGAEWLQPSLFI